MTGPALLDGRRILPVNSDGGQGRNGQSAGQPGDESVDKTTWAGSATSDLTIDFWTELKKVTQSADGWATLETVEDKDGYHGNDEEIANRQIDDEEVGRRAQMSRTLQKKHFFLLRRRPGIAFVRQRCRGSIQTTSHYAK